MPKQLFQRPAHVTRTKGANFGNQGQQQDWGRKKGKIVSDPAKSDQKKPAPKK